MEALDNAENFMLAVKLRLERATPGPWRIRPDIGSIHGPDGEAIKTGGEYFKGDEPWANAELIAAAPDDLATLLKVCMLMKKEIAFQAQPFVGSNGTDFDYTARATRMQEKAWELLERVNQICRRKT